MMLDKNADAAGFCIDAVSADGLPHPNPLHPGNTHPDG